MEQPEEMLSRRKKRRIAPATGPRPEGVRFEPYEVQSGNVMATKRRDGPGRHGGLGDQACDDQERLRQAGGSCWRCKSLKKKCDAPVRDGKTLPCTPCTRNKAKLWDIPCKRGKLDLVQDLFAIVKDLLPDCGDCNTWEEYHARSRAKVQGWRYPIRGCPSEAAGQTFTTLGDLKSHTSAEPNHQTLVVKELIDCIPRHDFTISDLRSYPYWSIFGLFHDLFPLKVDRLSILSSINKEKTIRLLRVEEVLTCGPFDPFFDLLIYVFWVRDLSSTSELSSSSELWNYVFWHENGPGYLWTPLFGMMIVVSEELQRQYTPFSFLPLETTIQVGEIIDWAEYDLESSQDPEHRRYTRALDEVKVLVKDALGRFAAFSGKAKVQSHSKCGKIPSKLLSTVSPATELEYWASLKQLRTGIETRGNMVLDFLLDWPEFREPLVGHNYDDCPVVQAALKPINEVLHPALEGSSRVSRNVQPMDLDQDLDRPQNATRREEWVFERIKILHGEGPVRDSGREY